MKLLKFLILIFSLSCSNQKVTYYQNDIPKLDLHEFFNGKLYAQGIVQDRSGQVIKRFNVDIVATWKNGECQLDEKFNYSDSTKSTRVWRLKEIGPFKFEGTAHDVVDVATGEVSGNTFYFQYVLDVPVGISHYNIHFDDWMYLLDKKTLLARSYMTKWGIRVGEVTLVMNKKE